jgi:hypothetical protein
MAELTNEEMVLVKPVITAFLEAHKAGLGVSTLIQAFLASMSVLSPTDRVRVQIQPRCVCVRETTDSEKVKDARKIRRAKRTTAKGARS